MPNKTILVLDPDQTVASLIAAVIEEGREREYEVVKVGSLKEAALALSDHNPDLVITEALDQQSLFDFDPAFLTELRAVAKGAPIIVCSAYPSIEMLRPGDYGLAEIISKPFEIEDLQNKVNKVLAQVAEETS